MGGTPTDISGSPIIYFPVNTAIQSTDVELYGETVVTSSRRINLTARIHESILRSIFFYQEDPQNRDNVLVTLSTNQTHLVMFTDAIETCLSQQVDLDMSYPWWTDGVDISTRDPLYQNQNSSLFHFISFYEFLLAQITYSIVGHPLAKAAIANDTAILTHFETQNVPQIILQELQASSSLKTIYKQLFRQKPSRFQSQDSTMGQGQIISSESIAKAIPFQAGDFIYFEVTLNSFQIKAWTGSSTMSSTSFVTQPELGNFETAIYGSNTFTLQIQIYGNSSNPWIEGTTYSTNDTVLYNGYSWRATRTTTRAPYIDFPFSTNIHSAYAKLGENAVTAQDVTLYHWDASVNDYTQTSGFIPTQYYYRIFVDPTVYSSTTRIYIGITVPFTNISNIYLILNNDYAIPQVNLTNGKLELDLTENYSVEFRSDRAYLIEIIRQSPPPFQHIPTPYHSDWILDTGIPFRTTYG